MQIILSIFIFKIGGALRYGYFDPGVTHTVTISVSPGTTVFYCPGEIAPVYSFRAPPASVTSVSTEAAVRTSMALFGDMGRGTTDGYAWKLFGT